MKFNYLINLIKYNVVRYIYIIIHWQLVMSLFTAFANSSCTAIKI